MNPNQIACRTLLILILSHAVLLLGQVAPANVNGSVEGIVLLSGSADPVPEAEITLVPQGSRGAPENAAGTTGKDGRFKIADVKPGAYTIQIRKLGYFSSTQNSTRYMVTAQITVAQQEVKDLEFRMVKGGVIMGRVVDEKGQPLIGVPMSALISSYDQEGNPRFAALNLEVINSLGRPNPGTVALSTNDKGEYRLFWLPPGSYYVRADYNPAGSATPQRAVAAIPQAITAYYPNANDPALAVRVTVRPGSEVIADVQVRQPAMVKVSGQLVETPPAPAAGSRIYRLYLVPRDRRALTDRAAREVAQVTMRPGSDGRFTLPFVSPGEYYLVARNLTAGYGQTLIDVRRDNLDDVKIEVPPAVNVKIQVTVEGSPSEVKLESLQGMGLRPEFFDTPWAPTKIAANGTGEVTNVAPGRYVFQALPLPGDSYFADVRYESRSILKEVITIGPEPSPIQVTISPSGGHVDGVVHDAVGKPVPALVTLLPQTRDRIPMTLGITRVAAEASGRFALNGLPPGEYKVFAWEEIPGGAELNSDFMTSLDKLGTRLTVTRGGRYNLELRLIPRDTTNR